MGILKNPGLHKKTHVPPVDRAVAWRLFRTHALLLLIFLTGCTLNIPESNYEQVSTGLKKSAGVSLPPENDTTKSPLPPGISLQDGLSEKEAVAIALWNNAQFMADLGQLGIARGEVLQAGQIQNPNFYVLFPIGLKQLEARLYWAFSEFLVRPHRRAIAALKARRTADQLIQNGLTLTRNTQVAFANLFQNRKTVPLAESKADLMEKLSEINQARLELGDTSEMDRKQTQIDALTARDQLHRLQHDGEVFQHRLVALLGVDANLDWHLSPEAPLHYEDRGIDDLLKIAFESSPELRMAEIEIQSAGEQIGLEQSRIFNFMAILDTKAMNTQIGPGISMDLPIFNLNQGGISRAEAQLKAAGKQYVAIRERIKLAVQETHTQYVAALQGWELLVRRILPQQEARLQLSAQALEKGEIAYMTHLEMQRQWINAQLRQTEIMGDLMRKTADLGLSLGRPIDLWSPAA